MEITSSHAKQTDQSDCLFCSSYKIGPIKLSVVSHVTVLNSDPCEFVTRIRTFWMTQHKQACLLNDRYPLHLIRAKEFRSAPLNLRTYATLAHKSGGRGRLTSRAHAYCCEREERQRIRGAGGGYKR